VGTGTSARRVYLGGDPRAAFEVAGDGNRIWRDIEALPTETERNR